MSQKLTTRISSPHVVIHINQCLQDHASETQLMEFPSTRATEMDITMIGLQNAGKTSLLRVLAVRLYIVSERLVHC